MGSIVERKAQAALRASVILRSMSTDQKDVLLERMAEALETSRAEILEANRLDVTAAKRAGASAAFIDRLTLDPKRIEGMCVGLRTVRGLPDPVGDIIRMWKRPNGLLIGKMRVPLGVIGIIYESRPNVTVDVSGLCLKSGNAVLLRGGSEALHSNLALTSVLRGALKAGGAPEDAVSFIETADRRAISEMLKLDRFIDVFIPRGGHALIRFVAENSRIPVISHGIGNCHVFVDRTADLRMASDIVFNAKVQRPGVCNAMETLLVHQQVARRLLPGLFRRLQSAGVEIRGDAAARRAGKGIRAAKESDWYAEYLSLILAVRVVDGFDEAVRHINHYGSHHSDAIVTNDHAHAQKFLREVDSACVYVNASTRFTDGGEFGMGAEMGISTQKLHARGPMALEELTAVKYVIYGDGQVRS
jgi:glutamate-5-semialdehyde dehydrogenase